MMAFETAPYTCPQSVHRVILPQSSVACSRPIFHTSLLSLFTRIVSNCFNSGSNQIHLLFRPSPPQNALSLPEGGIPRLRTARLSFGMGFHFSGFTVDCRLKTPLSTNQREASPWDQPLTTNYSPEGCFWLFLFWINLHHASSTPKPPGSDTISLIRIRPDWSILAWLSLNILGGLFEAFTHR